MIIVLISLVLIPVIGIVLLIFGLNNKYDEKVFHASGSLPDVPSE